LVFTGDSEVEEDGSQAYGVLQKSIATKVEPASQQDIFNFDNRNHTTIHHINDPSLADTCIKPQVILDMLSGEILDIDHIPTLIIKDFAVKIGLSLFKTNTEVTSNHINSSETILFEQCDIRLTMTTVPRRLVSITISALYISELAYQILLGIESLDNYREFVAPHHIEEARIIFDTRELRLPMTTETSVLKWQELVAYMHFYVKVETLIKRSVKIRQTNSYPKVKDGQPRHSRCFDDIHCAHELVENTYQNLELTKVTLKIDKRTLDWPSRETRCSIKDWKNPWSKWLGSTSRQKLNKTNNAVEEFPQSNLVNVSKNSQSKNLGAWVTLGNLDSYVLRGLYNSERLIQMASDRYIEKSSLLPDFNDFKMGGGNLSHKKRRKKGITVKSHNEGVIAFKSDQIRQRSKTYFDKEPKENTTTRVMDRVAYKTPLESSLKRTSSLTRAEAIETARSREKKRNTSWYPQVGMLSITLNLKPKRYGTKERVALPIYALRHTGKNTSYRDRSAHKIRV